MKWPFKKSTEGAQTDQVETFNIGGFSVVLTKPADLTNGGFHIIIQDYYKSGEQFNDAAKRDEISLQEKLSKYISENLRNKGGFNLNLFQEGLNDVQSISPQEQSGRPSVTFEIASSVLQSLANRIPDRAALESFVKLSQVSSAERGELYAENSAHRKFAPHTLAIMELLLKKRDQPIFPSEIRDALVKAELHPEEFTPRRESPTP